MKRIISIFLVIMMMVPVVAFASDYSSMSEEELLSELNAIRVELVSRTQDKDKVLLNTHGLTATVSSDIYVEKDSYGRLCLYIPTKVVNSSEDDIHIHIDSWTINGWEVDDADGFTLGAGNKEKMTFKIVSVDEYADITSVEDIEDVEAYYYSDEPNTYKTYDNYKRTKIIF